MKSLGGQVVKKAMWLYPKVSGFSPSERWGHSTCCYNGVVYIFGGCCGGLHFSDVLTLNLDTMTWNTLVTMGQRPGARDSHSSVLVGHKMIVFGGTNGSKKVNDLHILDLRTREWSSPNCEGLPPTARESHTATVIDEDKLIVLGGSGEGEANYLNDLHVLDLKTMRWNSPGVEGDLPAPRDSHIAVAIGNKLLVYGGDCGDRYLGEVDVLDFDTMTWSRLAVQGSLPGVRAGHAAVTIGTKVYIIGGVGDKLYFNDVWVLDISTCSWTQLRIRGQQPQGRFSHTAVVTDSDVAIYGGCGEDERPLNELLILQLGAEHPNGRYNISLCKIFGKHWNEEHIKFSQGTDTNSVFENNKEHNRKSCEPDSKNLLPWSSGSRDPKKRKGNDLKGWEVESEQEEHSLSLSQHSSPSQSDQEQTPTQKFSTSTSEPAVASHSLALMKEKNQIPHHQPSSNIASKQQLDRRSGIRRTPPQGYHFIGGEHPKQLKPEQFLSVNHQMQEVQYMATEPRPVETALVTPLIGAEVHGKVDGAFDSGYLMTVNVNGKILRGVLVTPGPGVVSRAVVAPQNPSSAVASPHPFVPHNSTSNCTSPTYVKSYQQPRAFINAESNRNTQEARSPPVVRAKPSFSRASRIGSDLQDVTLTLGGPTAGHGGLQGGSLA